MAAFTILQVLIVRLPLFNVTGYEFSALNAIFLSVLSLSLVQNKKFCSSDKSYQYTLHLLFVFLPLVISIIATICFSVCPLDTNSLFYIVITIPAYFLGLAIGKIALRLSPKYSIVISGAVIIILCIIPAIEIFIYPQVYFYNPIIGFLPGTIYDEDFSITTKLLVYRGITILLIVALFYVLKAEGRKFKQGLFWVVTIYLVFLIFKPSLGFATTTETMYDYMGGKTETEHFNIYFSSELKPEQVKILEYYHEFYFARLKEETGYETHDKISSFVFPDDDTKKRLFGSRNADVARIWTNQIFVEFDNMDVTLKHELVHIFSAVIGVTPFKIADNFNFAMIEGYAMAYENNYRNLDIDYSVALAYNNGFKVKLTKLFGGLNFFGNASSLSYLYSGSFIKYIKRLYGNEIVNKLYTETDFKKYTGRTLEELQIGFFEYIDSLPKELSEHKANLRFGFKPLVKKVCPRYLAAEKSRAWKIYAEGNYEEAKNKFSKLLHYADDNESLFGFVRSSIKTDSFSVALKEVSERMQAYKGTAYYYNIELLLADLSSLTNDENMADSLYREVLIQNPAAGYYNAAYTKLKLLGTNNLNKYLLANHQEKVEITSQLLLDTGDYTILSRLIDIAGNTSFLNTYIVDLADSEKMSGISALLAEKISIFCLNNYKFELANKFVLFAKLKNDNPFKKYRLNELELLTEWFIKCDNDNKEDVRD